MVKPHSTFDINFFHFTDTTTTERSKIESSVPKRDYFPVKTDSQDYDQPSKSDHTDYEQPNSYQESKVKLPQKMSDEDRYYESGKNQNKNFLRNYLTSRLEK